MKTSKKKDENEPMEEKEEYIFNDLKYICGSTGLITEALQKGCDVAQLPNGDVIITEVKTISTQYSWDRAKQRMVKINQG